MDGVNGAMEVAAAGPSDEGLPERPIREKLQSRLPESRRRCAARGIR